MSENMVTEKRDVAGFDGVALGGLGSVLITQDDRESLTIEAPEEVMSRVTSEIKNGVLVLGLKKGLWMAGLGKKNQKIRFKVTMRSVHTLRLGGVGRIDAPEVMTDSLSVVVGGVGGIEIGKLTTESLEVVLSGAGSCEIAGNADTQSIKLSGSGNYEARDLETKTTSAVVSGAGNVSVHVTETLDAKISGAGSIRYHGAPTVRQRVTGAGSISCTYNE
jgi:hypothetical protein